MPVLLTANDTARPTSRKGGQWPWLASLLAGVALAVVPAAHAAVVVNTGTPTYNHVWPNPSSFTNNGGIATFTLDSGSESSPALSATTNAGTVIFAATQHLSALTINGGKTEVTSGTLKTYGLTFASSSGAYTGTLDLTNEAAVVEATASTKATTLSSLQAEIAYGKTHSTGITSSTLTTTMTIALVDNAVFGQTTFRGVSVDSNSLLIVPAIIGDANLDGTVDSSDLSIVLANLGKTASSFTAGNFDGAATIDLTDLNDVLNNIGTSVPTGNLTLAIAARPDPNFAAVPEPASLVLAVPGVALALRRRRGC